MTPANIQNKKENNGAACNDSKSAQENSGLKGGGEEAKESSSRTARLGQNNNNSHNDSSNSSSSSNMAAENPQRAKSRSWEESFALLKSFQEKHGHCNVPTSYDKRLYRWCRHNHTRTNLTQEQVEKLESIGFSFEDEHIERKKQWNKMFDRLEAYKFILGHFSVPCHFSGDPSLSAWVRDQNDAFNDLPQEYREKLDSLGLAWRTSEGNAGPESSKGQENAGGAEYRSNLIVDKNSIDVEASSESSNGAVSFSNNNNDKPSIADYSKTTSAKNSSSKASTDNAAATKETKECLKWEDCFNHLKAFKTRFGHCVVPQDYQKQGVALGNWVANQRWLASVGRLPNACYAELTSIGFFVCKHYGDTSYKIKWHDRYNQLVQFHREKGHCRVTPAKDKALAEWVRTQRSLNRHGQIRKDRKALLEEINFDWNLSSKSKPEIPEAAGDENVRTSISLVSTDNASQVEPKGGLEYFIRHVYNPNKEEFKLEKLDLKLWEDPPSNKRQAEDLEPAAPEDDTESPLKKFRFDEMYGYFTI